MALHEHVRIAGRFLRSVRIDTDLGEKGALDGFVCPQSSSEVLMTMARHVSETGQGAFTWTGPYGSGKSSLVVALSALLDGNSELQKQAREVFGNQLTKIMQKSLPTGTKGWRILPVVGRRASPVGVIGDAIKQAGFVSRLPRGGWNERNLVAALSNAAKAHPRMHGGLIVFIDEMGKFLESASQDSSDIFVLQELAETASRSNRRLIIVGVLHQAFEEYAYRLSHETRDEWAKIQGRFIDLVVDTAGEEQLDLISRAIESDRSVGKAGKLANAVASLVRRDRSEDSMRLAATLEACWPLHPVVASLLGPISRRRFGQNQRSIFGFLNSSELHGFQDFLKHASDTELYGPDRLWDYLRVNLEPSILASPDGHRWALAAEAMERCESIGGDALHLKLLKAIAVIDLFKERSGLFANFEMLRSCVPGVPMTKFKAALDDLDKKWSFTIFKKFLDAHAIYAGSDFDIELALKAALDEIDEIDFQRLNRLAGIQPILAKRHYHETGTMRWFDVNIVSVSTLAEYVEKYEPANGAIGQFLLAVPTEGESESEAYTICRKAARFSGTQERPWDIIVGISKRSWAVIPLARELFALESVSNNHPELAGDAVARREVYARLAELQSLLETELHAALDNAEWIRKHYSKSRFRHADLNGIASELAGIRFSQSPRLQNELLNRHKPSSNAVAAQNVLLRNMVLREGDARLGIKGFPAEGGLFTSLLEATGLYQDSGHGYHFVSPSAGEDDAACLHPIWDTALQYVRANLNRTIPISDILDIWRRPPYGMKNGVMPILSTAFILSQHDKLAIYREGIFRAKFDDIDVELLSKDSSLISVRWMDLSGLSRKLLSGMADIVRDLDQENALEHLKPIDVARGLIAIHDNLPAWTKRTMRLSTNAMLVRDLFRHAKDPNKILFDDLPGTLGEEFALSDETSLNRVIESVRQGLEELVAAYPAMLNRLRDLMLTELQVPNIAPQSMLELRERAENIRQLAGDFRLENFVGRLSKFDGSRESFEGIASLAANKPPRNWVDPDLDQTAIELAEMAQKFIRAETYAHVKGRRDKRQAMAVVIGMGGSPEPLLEEFDISDSDRATVDELIARVRAFLEEAEPARRSVILATLAELSAQYIQSAYQTKGNGKRKSAS